MDDDAKLDPIVSADVLLTRDTFMRELIRQLAGTLEDVVGIEDAAGYISVVGQAIGEKIDSEYRRQLSLAKLDREQVGAVLVDLKRRIDGEFYIIEEDDTRIVFGNRRCPFGAKVIGRRSMCMMTSNVFGYIAAQNLGYAKVELAETIAEGHGGCKVIVYLREGTEADAAEGREYVGT